MLAFALHVPSTLAQDECGECTNGGTFFGNSVLEISRILSHHSLWAHLVCDHGFCVCDPGFSGPSCEFGTISPLSLPVLFDTAAFLTRIIQIHH
jgi:hypothetical protein